VPNVAEVQMTSPWPDAVGSALRGLCTRGVVQGASSMHWRVESSTGALAYDTPSVVVHAADCEALCAGLLGLVRVSSGGVVRGERVGWVRRGALCTRMYAVLYQTTGMDPNSLSGRQAG
jgi:hypothetical protein